MHEQSILIFKCLSDSSRLRIMNHLLKKPMYVELISELLGITPATVSFHLKKLEAAGLVQSVKEQYYTMYSAQREVFNQSLLSLIKVDDVDEMDIEQEKYNQKVIGSFFKYGKLISIPVQQKKRNIVLAEIAKRFTANRTYTEKEVNLIIAEVHDDFCTIRRELVSAHFMERHNSIYKLM